jgi:hypothetical protein
VQAHELPPPAQMMLLLGGFRISQRLYAAAALGVAAQLIAGTAAAEVLGERTGAQLAVTMPSAADDGERQCIHRT